MNFMCSSADVRSAVSPDCVRETVQKILRSAQVRFTDEQLAEQSGVSARCIKSYRVEGREPSLSNALSLLLVLGRGDLNRVLHTIGYSARPLDESDELQPCEIVAGLMAHGAVIAEAAKDRRFDHHERPACQAAADAIIETVLPLSSAGAAA